jgi:ribosome-associated translation inhibitor RaiA
MKTEFVMKGFQKTASMEHFLRHHTIDVIQSFLQEESDMHLRVSVDEDSHRNQARKPHFVCEVQLKMGRAKKYFKVRKGSNNFHEAVIEAGRAMKRTLGRYSDKRHNKKVGSRLKIRDSLFENTLPTVAA